MGRGHKRGRTQRKHFKQSRENVWKDDHSSAVDSADPAVDGNDGNDLPERNTNPRDKPSWQPFATENQAFNEYYKTQRIVSEGEWDEFISVLRKPLPAAFRINSSGQFFEDIMLQLKDDFAKSLHTQASEECTEEAIRPLPWYPGNIAWHLNFSRMQLRKNQALERFHEFLKQENEVGNITRQEAVSMVPPLFLHVLPEHHVLDMCAAPGSKTFQILELMHQSIKPGELPTGMVIANDVDVQRCNLLIHQTKRMSTANLVVTNHEAQHFPICSTMRDSSTGNVIKHGLFFDCVLCDVPCSGDGTLRKAPDIWRKWNAGMGNGLHRLQVEIALRGLALLKVGGRMVYSTCSMNPVENEAVIAEVLRRSGGSVELLDVSRELPGLTCRPGLNTWKIRDRGVWLSSFKDVPRYRRNVILPSMFPSGQSCEQNQTDVEDHDSNVIKQHKMDAVSGLTESTIVGSELVEVSDKVPSGPNGLCSNLSTFEVSGFPLDRCMRIVPHDQNGGAFFVAVLHKLSSSKDENDLSGANGKTSGNDVESVEDNLALPTESSEAVSCHPRLVVSELSTDLIDLTEQPEQNKTSNNIEVVNTDDKGRSSSSLDKKRKLQIQGKWRGVDPVVFFTEELILGSIISFYGINESFPLKGHLVTRNEDADHVKRIYYVSKSVKDVLQLNFQVGQRLKITSLGLKTFERQSTKDGSPCPFRLSSEGLPLLLPYISKQILYAGLCDFRHLLKYRTIKFPDFVDAKFGEQAAALMPGCCVVVLRQEISEMSSPVVDGSTISIVCWKGKTNLCVMVSPLDGRELLERLEVRYSNEGSLIGADGNMEVRNSMDMESVDIDGPHDVSHQKDI